MDERRKRDIGTFAAIGDTSVFLRRVDQAVLQASEKLAGEVAKRANSLIGTAQGFFAENWHAETFNIDAVLNRSEHLRATVLNSTGLPPLIGPLRG